MLGRGLENRNSTGRSGFYKLKQPAGDLLENIISCYQNINDAHIDEDTLFGRCRSAISSVEKMEKEMGNDFSLSVQVLIECKFAVNSNSEDVISVSAERTTDSFGVYKLDIPPVEGFQCKQGLEIKSFCRSSLIESPSSSCSIPGMRSSSAHMAIKSKARDICILNLNTLNFHPVKKDNTFCGADKKTTMSENFDTSLCFWPFFPPFGFPWPNLPFPVPGSLPFSIPSWILQFLKPPYLPFPLTFPPTSPPAP